MQKIRVAITLPYLLILPSGPYSTPKEGGTVYLSEVVVSMPGGAGEVDFTQASTVFDFPDAHSAVRLARSEADRLLRRVNHLLRWYRVTTGDATVIELTQVQASPFQFTESEGAGSWSELPVLRYEVQPLPLPAVGSRAAFGDAVRRGMDGNSEPDVALLNLLDAEHALSVGRFREAVLLSWGAIDSTFVRKFKKLVDERLVGEWGEGREFLKGNDFGLRHKMTTGLRLLTGRSLHTEPDGFWEELCISYGQRNKIIHEGDIAHQHDAERAIATARKLVQIVTAISTAQSIDGVVAPP